MSAIYVRCDPNQGTFLDNFGLALGILPTDLSFQHIMKLVEQGAPSAISQHNKEEIWIVIDDVSNKIDYLQDLESRARILSEIKGVSVIC